MLREAIWPEPKDITDIHNRTEKNPGNMASSPVPVWLKAVSQCTRKTKHLLWAALKRCFHRGHLSQDLSHRGHLSQGLSHDQHLRNICWMLSNDNSWDVADEWDPLGRQLLTILVLLPRGRFLCRWLSVTYSVCTWDVSPERSPGLQPTEEPSLGLHLVHFQKPRGSAQCSLVGTLISFACCVLFCLYFLVILPSLLPFLPQFSSIWNQW